MIPLCLASNGTLSGVTENLCYLIKQQNNRCKRTKEKKDEKNDESE